MADQPNQTVHEVDKVDGGAPADVGRPVSPAAEVLAQEADPRVRELEDFIVHLKADFDNYKKRVQKEAASAIRMGELETVKRFLPAFANVERALAAAKTAGDGGPLADGVKGIHSQVQGILAQMGVERIPAAGLPFNPALHEAVAAAAQPDVPPGTVTAEYEPGYAADGRALVHAKVRVSTAE